MHFVYVMRRSRTIRTFWDMSLKSTTVYNEYDQFTTVLLYIVLFSTLCSFNCASESFGIFFAMKELAIRFLLLLDYHPDTFTS